MDATRPDLGAICSRPTVGRGLFRGKTQATQEVTEYHLTEAQCLFIAAKCETAPAVGLLKEMVHVFMLARRLGYADPRMIRKLIKSLIATGKLSDSEVVYAAYRTSDEGGRPAKEYHLTEAQALFVSITVDAHHNEPIRIIARALREP